MFYFLIFARVEFRINDRHIDRMIETQVVCQDLGGDIVVPARPGRM
jgi:hypothetical protein